MRVRDLLTDESKWTQGAYAKNESGRTVPVGDKNASCWCLQGAISQCYYREPFDEVAKREGQLALEKVEDYLEEKFGTCCITEWNDFRGRKFEEIRQLVETLDI